MTFEQKWIERDFNPFLLFDSSGKLLSLNDEAQFLLGTAHHQEIFKLALTYASSSFGFKHTFLDLEFGRFKFFGIMVGYEDEDSIGIRLYQAPVFKTHDPCRDGEMVNLYMLIDLCISINSIDKKREFAKLLDPTMPDIKLKIDSFMRALNAIVEAIDSTKIEIKLSFRVGEYIKFGENKYPFYSLSISADHFNKQKADEAKKICSDAKLYYEMRNSGFCIDIPIV